MFPPDWARSGVALHTVASASVLGGLAVASLAIHAAERRRAGSFRWPADSLTFAAAALAAVLVAQSLRAVVYGGLGRHVSDVSADMLTATIKYLFISQVLWALANTFFRGAVTLLLHRVFWVGESRAGTQRVLVAVSLALSFLYGLATLLTAALICDPLQAAWDPRVEGRCGDQRSAFVGLEVGGLLLDLYILLAPIRQLHMAGKKKLEVIMVLSLGGLVTFVTGLRTAVFARVDSPDFTYDLGYLGLLSIIGALLGIITCCVQSFPKFLSRMPPGDSVYKKLWLQIYPAGTRDGWDRKGPSNDDDKSAAKPREGSMAASQTVATRGEKGGEKHAFL